MLSNIRYITILLLSVLSVISAGRDGFQRRSGFGQLTGSKKIQSKERELGENWRTYYYETIVDKFGFDNDETFKMRFLVNESYWEGKNGPILFYAGNEGDVTGFAANTGVMFELAAEVHGLVVFAEHRYYGESKVNGNKNLNYLSAELALADYAEFLNWFKKDSQMFRETSQSPVVVFGGSYGGMLAAWMRIKYPFTVIGAWAASAPVAWFGDLTDCNAYNSIIKKDFAAANKNCPENVLKSWDALQYYSQNEAGWAKLTEIFNLCEPIKSEDDVMNLGQELAGAWSSVVMVNYPYPTSFLQVLPAWPVEKVCSKLSMETDDKVQILQGVAAAAQVYFNYDGSQSCFNISQTDIGLDDNLWGFQACTEMVMPMCSKQGDSVFPTEAWDLDEFKRECMQSFNLSANQFRPNWMIEQFGARNIKDASNIIFSNGDLDPWQAGGVSDNMGNPTLNMFYITQSAHHLDLRSSNSADPKSVSKAREQEKSIVKKWLREYYKENMDSL